MDFYFILIYNKEKKGLYMDCILFTADWLPNHETALNNFLSVKSNFPDKEINFNIVDIETEEGSNIAITEMIRSFPAILIKKEEYMEILYGVHSEEKIVSAINLMN
jgi:hypothetical protein